jgi:hypothetical protein
MDAPRGRYRIVEKDGRLVVIDNGKPLPPSVAPPPRSGRGPMPAPPVGPAGPAAIDRAADLLLKLAVTRWDNEGRAVIAWKWRQNRQERRWDALLDDRQQRRLGRALLAVAAAAALIALLFVFDAALAPVGTMVALPPLLWGVASIRRLYRETNDPSSSTR